MRSPAYPWLTSHVFARRRPPSSTNSFSAREIADVLGHSRPSLTYVYMHRGAANPAAGAALNEALRPRTG